MTKKIFLRTAQVITAIFAGFNGFITKWSPPAFSSLSETSFEVGFTSFSALIILLIISAISKHFDKVKGKIWIGISIVIFVGGFLLGIFYRGSLNKHVIEYQIMGVTYFIVEGSELSRDAKEIAATQKTNDIKKIMGYFGPEELEQVWTKESRLQIERKLSTQYIFFVLLLCTSLFCLTEGLFNTQSTQS